MGEASKKKIGIKAFIVYLPYLLAIIVGMPVYIARNTYCRIFGQRFEGKLCIEAGEAGWKIIEYQELFQTAVEYIGDGRVTKVVINKDQPYLSQVYVAIKQHRPSHYAYSPRTGSQTWAKGLIEAFGVMLITVSAGVVPIVFLTDLPVRLWRAQSCVVTAFSGIVVTLMPPRLTSPIFPHRRIIGPYLMPFSKKTFQYLLVEALSNKALLEKQVNPIFIGSLYEPRASKLENIRKGLAEVGIQFEIKGRTLGSPRKSDEQYWQELITAPIVVTTADQVELGSSDWHGIPHFIYRYMEAIACGTLLVAPKLSGIEKYFTAGQDYVGFTSIDDAVEKITFYITHREEREKIAKVGQKKAQALIEANSFWLGIDIALGVNSIT